MILLIDNYDSFVWNLARYVSELGHTRIVVRNDATSLDDITALAPTHIIVSPGPCSPAEAGISNAVIAAFGASVPILGVCLGHQCIGAALGGKVARARRPMHGKTSLVRHDGTGVFAGLPAPLRVTRYHSLIVEDEALPECLQVTARSDQGEIMALAHRTQPTVGVQFHPEAVLTEHGHELLRNFLQLGAATSRTPAPAGTLTAARS
ncbi:MAG: aminodeoxychorismate/anthranilate synthase component II [Geminicoccaceae bacterium]